MTSETRTFIDLWDISAIEYGCPKCGASIVYPLNKQYDRLEDVCPNCHEAWFPDPGAIRHPATPRVSDQIRNVFMTLQKIKESPGITARIRLRIDGVEKS